MSESALRIVPRFLGILATAAALVLAANNALFWGVLSAQPPATAPATPKAGTARALETVTDYLTQTPFDRLTLANNTVYDIDPIVPRPLPVIDPNAKTKRPGAPATAPAVPPNAPAAKKAQAPPDNTKGQPNPNANPPAAPTEPIDKIVIHLLAGEVRDFQIDRNSIKSIIYFEDMLLKEADKDIASRKYTRAFELLVRVRQLSPNWEGLDARINNLLFAEASSALQTKQVEQGLRLLTELKNRAPDHPGLTDKLVETLRGKILKAFDLGFYAEGRRSIRDAETLLPGNVLVREAQTRFTARAQELMNQAQSQKGMERLDLLTEALLIWPTLPGLEAVYETAFRETPTLDAGVFEFPRDLGVGGRSPASVRIQHLIYSPVLGDETEEALTGKLPDQLAAKFETAELGRRMTVTLKPGIPWSDGTRNVASPDLAAALIDRANPISPAFRASWADLFERVDILDASRVEVFLTRPTLRPAAWFLDPVGPAHAADGWVSNNGVRQLVGNTSFRWASQNDQQIQFLSQPNGRTEAAPKILRIRELLQTSPYAAVQDLIQGKLSLLDGVPPDMVPRLRGESLVQVGTYDLPRVHMIAIDGRNASLRNRTLRRALSVAIDRKSLLQESVLRRNADERNALADGPFIRGSYANAPDVKPLEYDPILARMLMSAAFRELGKAVRLRFEYPALPEARAVAPRLIDAWKKAGIEVEGVERSPAEWDHRLRTGQRFDLAYWMPICRDPVTQAGATICPGYEAPNSTDALTSVASPRILQLLMRLETITDRSGASDVAVALDRESRDELPILPLWELQHHYAWHQRLKGPNDANSSLYQNIKTWEIAPCRAGDL